MANNKKPIDKEYLIASLKDFDKEILSKKYSSNGSTEVPSGVKDIDEIISELNEKNYLKGLATETKVTEEIETHTETMKDIIRDGYQTILDEDISYFTGVVLLNDSIPSAHELVFTNTAYRYNNKINVDNDGYIELKARHIYCIYPIVMASGKAVDVSYRIADKNGNLLAEEYYYAETGNYSDYICPIIYPAKEDCAICIKLGYQALPYLYQYGITIYEIKQPVYTNVDISSFAEKIGDTSEDTPVGHIIPFMGNNAPAHYLICDGSEYNIDDYKDLANHFISEFGTANHFGGDGITTFAVPDLRGEFLRGTGTATRDIGSGADVGEHQDPTEIIGLYSNQYNTLVGGAKDKFTSYLNEDKYFGQSNTRGTVQLTQSTTGATQSLISTRPTNTSITWCIKAEHTYFVKFEDAKLYSEQERVIGKWIDNKLLYQKVLEVDSEFFANSDAEVPLGIENFDDIFVDKAFSKLKNNRIITIPCVLDSDISNVGYFIDVDKKVLVSKVGSNGGFISIATYFILNYTKK